VYLSDHVRVDTRNRIDTGDDCKLSSAEVHAEGGGNWFNCTVCSMKFKYASELQRHVPIHTGEQPFSCKVCDKRFSL